MLESATRMVSFRQLNPSRIIDTSHLVIFARPTTDADTAKAYDANNEVVASIQLFVREREIVEGLAALPRLTTRFMRTCHIQKLLRIIGEGVRYGLALGGRGEPRGSKVHCRTDSHRIRTD